jgi:hypothetical protein
MISFNSLHWKIISDDPLTMVYRPSYPWYFNPLPMVYQPPTYCILIPLLMVYRHPTHGTLTPYLWYIDPLLMAYRVPYPWYIYPYHGILTLLPMVHIYRPPYPWYFDPLPMVFWSHTHGTSTPLSMVFLPPCSTHGISNPLPMIFWPPAYLLIRNEGVKIPWGFNLPYRGINIPWGSKYHMTPVLSSFMNYPRICNQINTTNTTSEAGTAYLSRAPKFSPGF